MRRVTRTPRARADLVDIASYIGQHSEDAMLRFLRAAQVAFNKLLEFPGMGPRCDVSHPKLAGLRFWPITGFRNYLIYYIPTQRGIRIVRVVHGSRDFHRLFEKP